MADILLDCLAGKLTSFDAICGYVSQLELKNAELLAACRAAFVDNEAGRYNHCADVLRAAIAKAEGQFTEGGE